MAKNVVYPLLLTSLDSSLVTANYAPINPLGFEGAAFFLKITNNSDESITISYDGINDHDFMVEFLVFALDTETNARPTSNVAHNPIAQNIYIKGTAGTGTVYLSGFYQK